MTMKKIKLALAVAVMAATIAPIAQATTIDVRHEWRDTGTDKAHRDRISISNRFANGVGVSVEAKFRGGKDETKPFNDYISNGTEIGASYLWKFGASPFTVETGVNMESSSTASVYKPYVRAAYKVSKDLSTNFRYRPYFERIGSGAGEDDHGYNLTWVVNYQLTDNISVAHELDYKNSDLKPQYDGKNYKFENDLKVTYKMDAFRPYVSVGNVAKAGNSDERQTRFRVGVQYVF